MVPSASLSELCPSVDNYNFWSHRRNSWGSVLVIHLMICAHQGARTGAVRTEKEGTQTRDISFEGAWIFWCPSLEFPFEFSRNSRVCHGCCGRWIILTVLLILKLLYCGSYSPKSEWNDSWNAKENLSFTPVFQIIFDCSIWRCILGI